MKITSEGGGHISMKKLCPITKICMKVKCSLFTFSLWCFLFSTFIYFASLSLFVFPFLLIFCSSYHYQYILTFFIYNQCISIKGKKRTNSQVLVDLATWCKIRMLILMVQSVFNRENY